MSSATNWACNSGREIFFDLDIDPPADQILQLVLQLLDFLPFAANDHARPGRIQNHLDFIASSLDFHLGNTGKLIFLVYVIADLLVFDQQIGKFFLRGIPAALPAEHDARAKTNWIDFLTHVNLLEFECAKSRRRGGMLKLIRWIPEYVQIAS